MKTLPENDNHGFVGLKQAVAEMVRRIDRAMPDLKEPVKKMLIAGGGRQFFYTGARVTLDVDASFSRRIMLPDDLVIPYQGPDGKILSVHLDRNYNTTFAVMHEDAEDDAVAIEGPEFDAKKYQAFFAFTSRFGR
ncbi:hypothetical protein ACFS07_36275 [Undibacterium arcticum]